MLNQKDVSFVKCVVMCAGSGERYKKPYPKQTEIIEGIENYKRTIKLFHDSGLGNIYISVSGENKDFFDHPNKIIGSNKREIDRFRNLREFIDNNTLILYGDVVYADIDVKKVLSSISDNESSDIAIFFGRDSNNSLTRKTYGEIFAVFVVDKNKFFDAVDSVADKFEKGIIKREIAWDVKRELGIKSLIGVSNFTDDYDTVWELFKIKKYILNDIKNINIWDCIIDMVTNCKYLLYIFIKKIINKKVNST